METRATGSQLAAPAEVFPTVSVSEALRRLGMMTPCAPAASAVRMIVGILNAVTDHQQRRFAPLLCRFQQIFQGDVLPACAVCRHALMHGTAGELGQLCLSHDLHRDSAGFRQFHDFLQTAALLADIDCIDLRLAAQRFHHRIASGNAILLRLCEFRRTCFP